MPPQQQQQSPVLSGTITLPTTVGGAIRQPPLMMPTTPIPPVSLQASGVMLPPPAVVSTEYAQEYYSLGYMPSMGFKIASSCVFCKTNKVIASFEKDKLHLSQGIIRLCITYRKVFPLNFL